MLLRSWPLGWIPKEPVFKRDGQWGKGKSFDGFGPIGPWLVTTDELPDPQGIALEARNDCLRETATSAYDD